MNNIIVIYRFWPYHSSFDYREQGIIDFLCVNYDKWGKSRKSNYYIAKYEIYRTINYCKLIVEILFSNKLELEKTKGLIWNYEILFMFIEYVFVKCPVHIELGT